VTRPGGKLKPDMSGFPTVPGLQKIMTRPSSVLQMGLWCVYAV